MKIVVFGATGGTGRELVRQALEHGHRVTAFARTPQKMDTKNENLRVVQGDVLNIAEVESIVAGQEAVVSALGSPALKENGARSEGTRNIVRAMEGLGVRRFISESAFGVGDSNSENLGFVFRYIVRPLFLRRGYAEHERQERYIRESSLDWIIARPMHLTDGSRTGTYQIRCSFKGHSYALKISRADVADFMLKQLTDDSFIHKTPGLSY